MDAFLRGTKRKTALVPAQPSPYFDNDEDSTDVKLAILASLHPELAQDVLMDCLLAHNGSVEAASASMTDTQANAHHTTRPGSGVVGSQTSLRSFATSKLMLKPGATPTKKPKLLSRKGATLRLYDPEDVAEHTPCSIIHNFLPIEMANDLLREMLDESKTFEKITFKIFDNVVSSPHTSTFYVETEAEQSTQKNEYYYNGASLAVSLTQMNSLQQTPNAHHSHLLLGRSHDYPTATESQAPGQPGCEQGDPAPHQNQVPGWPEAQISIPGPLAAQCCLCQLLHGPSRARRLPQRPTHLPGPTGCHRLTLPRCRPRVPRTESTAS